MGLDDETSIPLSRQNETLAILTTILVNCWYSIQILFAQFLCNPMFPIKYNLHSIVWSAASNLSRVADTHHGILDIRLMFRSEETVGILVESNLAQTISNHKV